ncbi:hypothetical protein [Flavobacterium suzhouense]|uniref:TonB C-terminal domain-containing protein n=1 Tax=Flavobacterium suzhouense TaxID=1529638 RepID=A0ABW5NT52_9FLAO
MTKTTIAIVLTFLSFIVNAQEQRLEHAVFKECLNTESPTKCTSEKIRDDISALISPEITADIRWKMGKIFFSVGLAFLSDQNGNVIPETIKIACDNKGLESAVKEYILHLSPFSPKGENEEDRRSAHLERYTFIYNSESKTYEAASEEILKEKGIKPNYVSLGNEPVLPKCACDDAEKAKKCTVEKLYEHISKRIKTNSIDKNFSGQIYLVASFAIEKDGSITVNDILCNLNDCEALINQYKRAFTGLPNFIPGNYEGVKVRATYNLPVTINIK